MSGFSFAHILYLIVIVADLLVAYYSFSNKDKRGKYLGYSVLSAVVITASYEVCLITGSRLLFSVMSSIYFMFVDVMLLFLLYFSILFTRTDKSLIFNSRKLYRIAIQIWLVADFTMLILNPFTEIAIKYIPAEGQLIRFDYVLLPLYWFHHAYTYVLVAFIVIIFLLRAKKVPSIYKLQYLVPGVLFVFALLSKLLYILDVQLLGPDHLDYSLIAYSLAAVLLYFFCYRFPNLVVMTRFRKWMFDNINQGVVLFDSDDCIMSSNEKAESIMPGVSVTHGAALNDFLSALGINPLSLTDFDSYSTLCYVRGYPVRCDYSVNRDKFGNIASRLFVLTRSYSNTDILTGFYSREYIRDRFSAIFSPEDMPVSIATLDINKLSEINAQYGGERGDKAIKYLADAMRECFPKDTLFIRCREAYLTAVCPRGDKEDTERLIERVRSRMYDCRITNEPIAVLGTASVEYNPEGIHEAIHDSLDCLRNKKLLDRSSAHSESLYSLINAFEQSDGDTGEHVRRTMQLSAALGSRLGLNDLDMSNLALLAMLHDIGKVGIPQEILNKPGALSRAEWEMLKTHVHKGYQIAVRSNELSGIADYILYHHERWDGKGYPEGLKGEEIPLLSRIIAIVDAYDAMSNNRAYRKALNRSKIKQELIAASGTQFDPDVTYEFISLLFSSDKKSVDEPDEDTDSIYTPPELPSSHRSSVSNTEDAAGTINVISFSRYVINAAYDILEVDRNFEAFTGYTPEEALKLNQYDLIFPEEREYYKNLVHEQVRTDGRACLEHRVKRKDGSERVVICTGKSFYNSALRRQCFEIVITDLFSTMTVKSTIDSGIANRLILSTMGKKEYTGCLTRESCRNTVNDLIGKGYSALLMHIEAGNIPMDDDLLAESISDSIYSSLRSCIRENDIICHCDPGKFCVVMFYEQKSNTDQITERAKVILNNFSESISREGIDSVTLSAGYAVTGDSTDDFHRLLEKAQGEKRALKSNIIV